MIGSMSFTLQLEVAYYPEDKIVALRNRATGALIREYSCLRACDLENVIKEASERLARELLK